VNKRDLEEFTIVKTDISYIKKALDDNNVQHKELKELITKFIEEADVKYAPRYVVYFAVGSFLTALGIIVSLII